MRPALIILTLCISCGGSKPAATPNAAPKASGSAARASGPSTTLRTGLSYDQLLAAAQSYLETGNPSGAEEAANEAIRTDPARSEGFAMAGRALAMQRKLPESAAAYEKALSAGANDARIYMELASVYDVAQQYDRAVAVYEKALQKFPKDAIELSHEMALTLLLAGKPKEGIGQLRKLTQIAPQNRQIRTDLGYALLQAGKAEAAALELQAVVDVEPKNGGALQLLARAKVASGDNDEALAILDKAVIATGAETGVLRTRAQLRSLTGNYNGARDDYSALTKTHKHDAAAWLGLAGALIQLNKLDTATTAVNTARKIVGDKATVQFRNAQIQWRNGDNAGVDFIHSFAEEHPAVLEAWRELERAAKKTGDKKLAKKAAKQLKELQR